MSGQTRPVRPSGRRPVADSEAGRPGLRRRPKAPGGLSLGCSLSEAEFAATFERGGPRGDAELAVDRRPAPLCLYGTADLGGIRRSLPGQVVVMRPAAGCWPAWRREPAPPEGARCPPAAVVTVRAWLKTFRTGERGSLPKSALSRQPAKSWTCCSNSPGSPRTPRSGLRSHERAAGTKLKASEGQPSGVGVTVGARPQAQPFRVGPGFIRAGFHATGKGVGEHEGGGGLKCAAEQAGGAGRLES